MGVKHILALSCAATGQAYLLQGLVSTRPSALVSVQPARTAVCEMNMGERFARLVKSNVNQAMNSMEDPEKVLTQAVEDMQKDLIKVRQAYAEVSASTKRMGEQCRKALSLSLSLTLTLTPSAGATPPDAQPSPSPSPLTAHRSPLTLTLTPTLTLTLPLHRSPLTAHH